MIEEVSKIVHPVYLVGGSVRDKLLGLVPKDYDFTTPLTPDEIEEAVRNAGKKPYLTGKRFGTVGFKIDEQLIEVTTFRKESYEPRSRKPMVEFVDNITFDLSRRDFTINAIAQRDDGSLVDPFGGQQDLKRKIIATVGKPQDRFKEDPLRMLRAARFASQLGFSIEAETEAKTAKRAHHILYVSKERWVQELDKLLLSDDPSLGLQFLAQTRLLHFMLPELAMQVGWDQDSPYHELDLWEHTIKTVCLTEKDINLRWAALLHDIGKPYTRTINKRGYSNYVYHDAVGAEMILKIGSYLRWSKERVSMVSDIVKEHLDFSSPLHQADSDARFRNSSATI